MRVENRVPTMVAIAIPRWRELASRDLLFREDNKLTSPPLFGTHRRLARGQVALSEDANLARLKPSSPGMQHTVVVEDSQVAVLLHAKSPKHDAYLECCADCVERYDGQVGHRGACQDGEGGGRGNGRGSAGGLPLWLLLLD